MRTRAEHLEWAKSRALEYVEIGDLAGAIGSLASDLGKWQGEEPLYDPALFRTVMADGLFFRKTANDVRNWIEGFR